MLYKFARIDNRRKPEVERLLTTVLACTCESDVKLLKFWMTGISQDFKENLRRSKKLRSGKQLTAATPVVAAVNGGAATTCAS